jgi:hypothetical protein
MAIKPIDVDEDELVEDGLPAGSLLKSIALLVIIISGMIFGYFYNENKHRIHDEMVKAGIRPTTSPSPLPFKPNAAYDPDVDSTLEDIRSESSKMVGSGVETVFNAGSEVLGDATENVTKNVSKSVQKTAADTTENVASDIYKNTLGQVIVQLFNRLPPPAKKDVAKELIKQLTPTKKPSPTPDPDFE